MITEVTGRFGVLCLPLTLSMKSLCLPQRKQTACFFRQAIHEFILLVAVRKTLPLPRLGLVIFVKNYHFT